MARNFSAASTDRSTFNASGLDNLSAGTFLAWIRPTTTTPKGISDKADTPITVYRTFYFNSSLAQLRFDMKRATTDLSVRTTVASVTQNAWNLVAVTFDSSLTNADQHLYCGSLTSSAAEVASYSTQQVGSGATPSDSGVNFYLGNNEASGFAFEGDLGFYGVWNRQLAADEIRAQQYRPYRNNGCVLFAHMGWGGSVDIDWSGTAADSTIVGTAQANHVPLGPAWGRDELGRSTTGVTHGSGRYRFDRTLQRIA